ncbi:uncharacterized protein LOC122133673 [Clupea harengus]|uniref:Uncharacterized protein LOC122133673 n=1 Tax=Clupea harengus TaxID=7950 RepID=A0A8M1KQW4_CLUHA|nr:uncharacterized protein LOC122133673 [Clupea harengus]
MTLLGFPPKIFTQAGHRNVGLTHGELETKELFNGGAEAAQATADASQAHLEKRLDYSLHLHDRTAPAVRTKTGANVQFPLPNLGTDRQDSKPIFLPRISSDIRPQQLHLSSHSFPSARYASSHSHLSAQHSSHSYSSAIPPVISQSYASSDQATRSTVTHQQIPSSTSSPQDNHVIKVLENQSELTRMLMKQQLLTTLPQGNIPLFDGQVLEYKSFIHSFENMIEQKTDNNRDRLQFLIQYTKGQAQRLVKSCEYMSPDRGYQNAKQLLKENFGNEYKISCAYLEKVQSWTQMKSEDSKMLQDYAMFLRSCCNAMEEMDYMQELDTISSMRSIALKLPFKLKEKWRNKAYELQERHQRRVRILDLVSFIEKQARIAADPVFGDLQDQSTSRAKVRAPTLSQPSVIWQ